MNPVDMSFLYKPDFRFRKAKVEKRCACRSVSLKSF